MMSWNTSTNCYNWGGVTCDDSIDEIIRLNLICGMLQGTINHNSPLFNLTRLTYLDLSQNQLNGTLPSWLFTSPSLQYLSLSHNMFSGNLLFSIGQLTNLTYLGLSSNNFSGKLELDTLLSSLKNLEVLDLSYNSFSLTTKNANHYVNPAFKVFGLASCKLKVFLNSFRAMKHLWVLDLSGNEIHGQIPHWVGEFGGTYGLEYFSLSDNFITGLPQFQWYGLEELYMQSNHIEGPFPTSICNMSNLWFLDMSNNRFGGLIPQCFREITSHLQMVDMGNNSLQGTIPSLYDE
nr:leucine-rich repeat-containing protein [Tanacetum cinerariifolium]